MSYCHCKGQTPPAACRALDMGRKGDYCQAHWRPLSLPPLGGTEYDGVPLSSQTKEQHRLQEGSQRGEQRSERVLGEDRPQTRCLVGKGVTMKGVHSQEGFPEG